MIGLLRRPDLWPTYSGLQSELFVGLVYRTHFTDVGRAEINTTIYIFVE